MENRRDFIKHASLLIAGGMVGGNILSGCGGGSASKKNIGLVIYSLRDDVKTIGIQKVLEIVAEMGYVNLEVSYSDGKFYDTAPAIFKKMVEDLGMKTTGAHLNRQATDNRDDDMAWWKTAAEACVLPKRCLLDADGRIRPGDVPEKIPRTFQNAPYQRRKSAWRERINGFQSHF